MAVAKAKKGRYGPGFSALPEGCIASVVSFTSPPDACRLASVSSIFKLACDSDVVWASFLPPDCCSMVHRSAPSLKELFFSLCDDPVLVGDGKMVTMPENLFLSLFQNLEKISNSIQTHLSTLIARLANSSQTNNNALFSISSSPKLSAPSTNFQAFRPEEVLKKSYSLDRHSGKKCIMLSARALSITWGDTPIHWSWTCLPNSRFAEVAELIDVCWLKIRGMISSGMLSPETHYAAYLVFKITPASYGFEFQPVKVEARFAGDEAGKHEHSVYLSRKNNTRGWQSRWRFRHAGRSLMLAPAEGNEIYPKERQDGWSEIELGEFLTKEGQDGEVEMSVMERGYQKAGLVVEGIEIRPKDGK